MAVGGRPGVRASRGRRVRIELMVPPPDEEFVHSPTWAVAGAGGWQPVTLLMALERSPARARPEMIAGHQRTLDRFVEIADRVLATTAWDAPERQPVGFNLLLFAAELASALNACLDQAQRRSCTETISAAALVAAVSLAAPALQSRGT